MVMYTISFASDYGSLTFSVLGLCAMLFGLFKFRETVGKSLIFLLRKVTRSKRR